MTYKSFVISFQCSNWKLIIPCLYLLLFSCSQSSNQVSTAIPTIEIMQEALTLHANEGLFYHLDNPFSGYAIEYYPNDILAKRIAYIEGKKEGLYQKWFSNGKLSFEANYVMGRKHGTSKTWWKNGALRSQSQHKMGIANGQQRQWYKSGQLFKSMNIVDGKEEGIQQAWRENGKIYNNYEAKNGRIFGLKRASLCYELEEEIVQYSNN